MRAIRAIAFVSAAVLTIVGTTPGVMAGDGATPSPTAAANGIDVVGPDALQFRATDEKQALAFDRLLAYATKNADEFGYPRASTSKAFVVPVVPTDGEPADPAELASLVPGFAVSLTTGTASISRLTEIANEVVDLASARQLPDGDTIWMTEPDQINNRIVVTVKYESDELFAALSKKYGDLVAVRIADGGTPESTGRNSDSPYFWGGAYWTSSTGKACTTGFAWSAGGDAMLTAAHCISTGGTASYPNYPNAGTVASASEENWKDGVGSQYYTGQSTYRGDVALIRYSQYGSTGRIYNGGPGTGTNTGVARMTTRRRGLGDAVCINGVTTGGWCGAVTGTGLNIQYIGDPGMPWVRNVSRAEAIGWTCPTHGDSGAPVYVNRDDGNVDGAGIFSGSAPLGIECVTFFTDIWDAYYGLPGTIKHI